MKIPLLLKASILLTLTVFALGGCGGSSNSSSPSPAPAVTPAASPSPSPSPSPSNSPIMSVENGIWASSNGQESATVTKSGATFQLGCAIGSTTQPLILDASDQFSVTGTYTLIGGPVVVGHARQFTANYTGTVSGETMILIVSFTDEASGTPQSFSYTLYYGAATDPHVICAD